MVIASGWGREFADLPAQVGPYEGSRGLAGQFGMVIGWCYLDTVHADEVQASEGLQ